jgi:hypothetical protein
MKVYLIVIVADDKISKRGKIYLSCVEGDMLGTAIEESTAIPLIVYLLYNSILVTCAYPFFGAEGYCRILNLGIYSSSQKQKLNSEKQANTKQK